MSSGEFDDVILPEWESEIKIEIPDIELPEIDEVKTGESHYSTKIEAPVYRITGEKPTIQMLYNTSKTDALIAEINKSNIDEEIKRFLISASHRHTIINFKNVAEYYAHSNKEIQDLFENNALIIIDFNKAIECGYVEMSKKILELVNE